MALRKIEGEIPSDAIRVGRKDACEYHYRVVRSWTPKSDVLALRHGPTFLAASTAISAIYINNHYRTKLKVLAYGKFITYLPIVVIPSVLSTIAFQNYVTNDILVQSTLCPLCVQLRAAAIQASVSTVYPAVLAPVSGFMVALRHYTYNVPVIKQPKMIWALWKKLTVPKGNTFLLIAAFNACLGVGIAYYQAAEIDHVHSELCKFEDNVVS